ncbi:glycoside hydrolase family 3 N-terminal domain-containing protein [Bifidobacterium felsineum]|uniref:Beta-glucosidase n=1 Tax=Bifidobacterium felsineum TaxID=2045440 RepID=A0A2M9HHY0_9BIFI|nr:glycoside hydrolase family 3 N-terminal domain-containing protein [Bifidobacterium felsineum]PJM76425.1 beta-glucosidase [Bifidobacterium felsineum]
MLAMACVLAVVVSALYGWCSGWFAKTSHNNHASAYSTGNDVPRQLERGQVPKADLSPAGKARRMVQAMDMRTRVGQLVMAPLTPETDPSSLASLIADRHVGSVLIIGNWNAGTASVRSAVDRLQGYAAAENKLIVATDQEGGYVQHLSGPGFDQMPSAVEQGTMTEDQLQQSASVWGSQLASAGINVDLAPVLGTVTVNRTSNAPIGALARDFGLDSAGNANHGMAFVRGMRGANIESAIKHYPGLGSVSGNTDFTTDGIIDTTTTLDGPEVNAFDSVIRQANPAMVMMALATYQAIDPNDPAVFSSTMIDGHIRHDLNYNGVVISDSMSAAALSNYSPADLGVKLVDAGGDLACVGETDYVEPILDGLSARADADPAFAAKVTQAATRVMTLKITMGLA